ncbi:MAG: FAD-dependent thymidylate synthase, partial [Treponema sp.]|nr:FAD-dependent thymidylate synthase [Treponema sp.]
FHVKMPIFVARQWVRHRMGRMNEVSGRYSVMKEEFYVPELDKVSPQSKDNKQGRATEAFDEAEAQKIVDNLVAGQKAAYENYSELLEDGVARELARVNLPLSLYTEFYWEMDLHNLFHFLKLRLDSHAQYEIRVYAEVMLEMCKKVAPMATESFINHMEHGVNFSGEEMEALRAVMNGQPNPLEGKKLDRFNEKIATGTQL